MRLLLDSSKAHIREEYFQSDFRPHYVIVQRSLSKLRSKSRVFSNRASRRDVLRSSVR